MGPGRFATENYFSQTSRLILIIITSLGLNIFSHEKNSFWLIGSGTLNIKTRKIPYPFSVMESMKFLRELHVDIETGIIVGETAITG